MAESAALIMGLDGIPVDTYVADGNKIDITTSGWSSPSSSTQVKKAADILQVGGVEELTVKARALVLVCRMLSPQYFVAVVLTAEGNFGKAAT